MERESVLESISRVQEFSDLHDHMGNDQLDRALQAVVNLVARPELPSSRAPALIVELQALAAQFSIAGTYYATFGAGKPGTPENHKKNMYKTLGDSITKLVDALKWTAKSGMEY